MADELISRQGLLKTLMPYVQSRSGDIFDAIDEIEAVPAVDAVEVVRCKDCKYLNAEYRCVNWKGLYDYTKADDFCSYAERKN